MKYVKAVLQPLPTPPEDLHCKTHASTIALRGRIERVKRKKEREREREREKKERAYGSIQMIQNGLKKQVKSLVLLKETTMFA